MFTARYGLNASTRLNVFALVLQWLSRLANGLSPRRPGFSPGSVYVRFLVDGMALRQFSPSTSVSPVRIIPLTFLTGLHVNLLMPNEDYSGRTAPLTSKCCILYIYSTIIGTEYFKHCI